MIQQRQRALVVGRRAFGTTPPADNKDAPKGPWERIRDYLLFRPGAPSWETYAQPKEKGVYGYRYPSPASRPHPNIPTVESEDDFYDTKYYTRDTTRNQALPQTILPNPPKEFPVEAPAELGSKGRKNPAVERYDPTGTRSAMTATWKSMNEELAKRQPDHLPRSWWERDPKIFEEAMQHARKNNIPLPIGVARTMGVARYGKNTW